MLDELQSYLRTYSTLMASHQGVGLAPQIAGFFFASVFHPIIFDKFNNIGYHSEVLYEY